MPLKTHREDAPALNLTPMIDIVFLLVIFFMVGTKFTELERTMNLTVPEVTDVGALTSAPQRREINVFRDGTVTLDRKAVTVDQLRDQLALGRREYADLGVVVRGDRESFYQNVATVLYACKQAGIHDINIALRPEQQP